MLIHFLKGTGSSAFLPTVLNSPTLPLRQPYCQLGNVTVPGIFYYVECAVTFLEPSLFMFLQTA